MLEFVKNVGANLCVRPVLGNIKTSKYLIGEQGRHIRRTGQTHKENRADT